jgi:hypothetical protein
LVRVIAGTVECTRLAQLVSRRHRIGQRREGMKPRLPTLPARLRAWLRKVPADKVRGVYRDEKTKQWVKTESSRAEMLARYGVAETRRNA